MIEYKIFLQEGCIGEYLKQADLKGGGRDLERDVNYG